MTELGHKWSQKTSEISIEITPEEQKLFDLFLEVVAQYTPSTQVRVVGGWTRDKLLGRQPKDVDIMVNDLSGEVFAKMITKHLNLEDPHIIKENPEKSKHLETAKVNLPAPWNAEIDVARCRKETYSRDSRVPDSISSASPEEDSLRRDFTINSLFYNISTRQLEDFTGHGLEDLNNQVIRAPGEPVTRFMEDPLRIFRAARFASRLGWQVEKSTAEAMNHPSVKEALLTKTAPERMGEELIKMMGEEYPDIGLEVLQKYGYLNDLVNKAVQGTEYEGQLENWNMDQSSPHHDLNLWDHTLSSFRNTMEKYPSSDVEKRVVMLLGALGHDLGKMFKGIWGDSESSPGARNYHGHEKHSQQILNTLLKYLKLHSLQDTAGGIAANHMAPYNLVGSTPKALRKFLRNMAKEGLEWVDVINMAISDTSAKGVKSDEVTKSVDDLNALKSRIEQTIKELESSGTKVDNVLLNGNEIMEGFKNLSPGAWIATVMAFVSDLVDENPNISKQEALTLAKNNFSKYVIMENSVQTSDKMTSLNKKWKKIADSQGESYKLKKDEKMKNKRSALGSEWTKESQTSNKRSRPGKGSSCKQCGYSGEDSEFTNPAGVSTGCPECGSRHMEKQHKHKHKHKHNSPEARSCKQCGYSGEDSEFTNPAGVSTGCPECGSRHSRRAKAEGNLGSKWAIGNNSKLAKTTPSLLDQIKTKFSDEQVLKAIKRLGEQSIAGYSQVKVQEVQEVLEMCDEVELSEILSSLG